MLAAAVLSAAANFAAVDFPCLRPVCCAQYGYEVLLLVNRLNRPSGKSFVFTINICNEASRHLNAVKWTWSSDLVCTHGLQCNPSV